MQSSGQTPVEGPCLQLQLVACRFHSGTQSGERPLLCNARLPQSILCYQCSKLQSSRCSCSLTEPAKVVNSKHASRLLQDCCVTVGRLLEQKQGVTLGRYRTCNACHMVQRPLQSANTTMKPMLQPRHSPSSIEFDDGRFAISKGGVQINSTLFQ